MAKYGSFTYINELYGYGESDPSSNITASNVSIIHPRLIQFNLNVSVLVNEEFYNVENYSIILNGSTSTDARPLKVLIPYQTDSSEPSLTTSNISVVTQPLTVGSKYVFSLSGLQMTDGSTLNSDPSVRLSRRTKTQSMLRSLPQHFSINFGSNVAGILSAIGISDDLIGGNQNEIP